MSRKLVKQINPFVSIASLTHFEISEYSCPRQREVKLILVSLQAKICRVIPLPMWYLRKDRNSLISNIQQTEVERDHMVSANLLDEEGH